MAKASLALSTWGSSPPPPHPTSASGWDAPVLSVPRALDCPSLSPGPEPRTCFSPSLCLQLRTSGGFGADPWAAGGRERRLPGQAPRQPAAFGPGLLPPKGVSVAASLAALSPRAHGARGTVFQLSPWAPPASRGRVVAAPASARGSLGTDRWTCVLGGASMGASSPGGTGPRPALPTLGPLLFLDPLGSWSPQPQPGSVVARGTGRNRGTLACSWLLSFLVVAQVGVGGILLHLPLPAPQDRAHLSL